MINRIIDVNVDPHDYRAGELRKWTVTVRFETDRPDLPYLEYRREVTGYTEAAVANVLQLWALKAAVEKRRGA